jgi:hypothetical protein
VQRAARRFWPRYAVGLVASLILLPGACSLGVVAWKLAAGDDVSSAWAFLFGTLVGVTAWVGVALPLRRLASPRYANPGVYRELTARHKELELVAETLESKDDRRRGRSCRRRSRP